MKNVMLGKRSFGSVMALSALVVAPLLQGCGKQGASFSILSSAQGFQQAQATVNNKIDILWVVDNSGSMDPLQQNLVNNFSAFMTNFQTKGFDFQMAVTTSDAYLASAAYYNTPALAKFRDGANGAHTGSYVINNQTQNALQTFITNATQGSNGSGDERVFQSLLDTLKSPLNPSFIRPGAFLAVVILSDEDDFSNYSRAEGAVGDHDYNQTGLLQVDSLISQLDTLTNSTAANRNYNVSAITVMDAQCQSSHAAAAPSTIVGTRYIDLVNKTKGILGSVCDQSYANALNFIQQRIVELTTQFKLDRLPKISTIQVTVNNVAIPNDTVNGWTYASDTNSVQFHGTAVPPAGASIGISFDPATLQ